MKREGISVWCVRKLSKKEIYFSQILPLRRQRQWDFCEFEASLVPVTFRPAGAA